MDITQAGQGFGFAYSVTEFLPRGKGLPEVPAGFVVTALPVVCLAQVVQGIALQETGAGLAADGPSSQYAMPSPCRVAAWPSRSLICRADASPARQIAIQSAQYIRS